MSRSIHENWCHVGWLRGYNFSDKAAKRKALDELKERVREKWRTQKAVLRERRRTRLAEASEAMQVTDATATTTSLLQPVAASAVPIRLEAAHPLVHHGASAEDVRAFLTALPVHVAEGITEIQLCMGTEYMEESSADDDDLRDPDTEARDPWFGRRSEELFPGCYVPPVSGTFSLLTGLIQIYAYVWNRELTPAMPSVVPEFYFRLRRLSTLAHEVAHHFDNARRVARGRWRFDRMKTYESYAERMQLAWTRDIILPYLKRRYADDWRAVQAWMRQRGGGELSLELMAGDPRTTSRNDRDGTRSNMIGCTSKVMEDLMASVAKGEAITESRLDYAWSLHLVDEYELSLKITEDLIQEKPDNVKALALHADTLEHLERYAEAHICADRALALDVACVDALNTKALLGEYEKDWEQLLVICDKWISHLPESEWGAMRRAHFYKAVALCAMGRLDEMEVAFRQSLPENEERAARMWEGRLRLVFRRAGVKRVEKV